ncbi:MAG: hypothetical protein M5U34_25375 [Chloroflexi bacterium]|nr:hypothetical protein [Chloroflexota bacterium]
MLHLKQTAVVLNLPETVQLYAKAEWFNPSGSVKDRAALHIIQAAEENGQLWPGMTLLDARLWQHGAGLRLAGQNTRLQNAALRS